MFFRHQALSHSRQDQTEGRILLRSPGILWGCSIASLLAACGIALLLFMARYTPHVRLSGRLQASDGSIAVQLLAPAHAIPMITQGQTMTLHYPALAKRAAGSVRSVSRVPQPSGSYPILLVPESPASLQAGMVVEADLALPSIRLIDWIVK
jgi:hypothetical protein